MLTSQRLFPAPSTVHPPAGCQIRLDDAQKQEGKKRKTKKEFQRVAYDVLVQVVGVGVRHSAIPPGTKTWAQIGTILRQRHKLIACEALFEFEHEWGAGREQGGSREW